MMSNKRVTIRTLYNLNKATGSPFFGDLSQFQFMAGYVMDYEYLDKNFMKIYKSFYPRWNLQYENSNDDVLKEFQEDIKAIMIKNEENYKRIYEVISSKYNPVYNYDRHEVIVDTHRGTDKLTDKMGARSQTNVNGAKKQTNSYGEQTNTSNYGPATRNDDNKLAGFNSTEYSNVANTTSTEQARTDVDRINAHNDNISTDASTDTITNDKYSDIHTTEHGLTIRHEATIEGNIGVTTATAMLKEHVDFWNNIYNFYQIIEADIIAELCTVTDNGYDAFGLYCDDEIEVI